MYKYYSVLSFALYISKGTYQHVIFCGIGASINTDSY